MEKTLFIRYWSCFSDMLPVKNSDSDSEALYKVRTKLEETNYGALHYKVMITLLQNAIKCHMLLKCQQNSNEFNTSSCFNHHRHKDHNVRVWHLRGL